jgi:hypothetical protein
MGSATPISGMNGYIFKPFKAREFIERIYEEPKNDPFSWVMIFMIF